ncbi:class I SAM-dependent methyltransferase [Catenovulum sp. SM1970]|uniref:class I SAM-dependent methyltransferase n=1 Tax=Marinifaba aquimaris TaxID=2741323 RepID=UPI0015733826|nr:class I SAM-dependent methyltransferase [Marinifaba aquimaris]NTS75710.1 class I SAM-dependent methyltransferase [Marinifaba aquimaris]
MFEFIQLPKDGQCQRLFHGRGHAYSGFSHVCIDWFEPVILVTLYQEVDATWLNELVFFIEKQIPQAKSIQVQYRCRARAPIELVSGDPVTQLVTQEHTLKFHIELGKSQNHGLFLDMKNGRDWLRQHAKDKKVLNLFAYTCAFSIAAVEGGASHVMNLDMSKASLARGRENHKLNQHDLTRVSFAGVDLFKSFGKVKRQGPFDILVCDPPAFQKGSVDIKRDYKKIIRRLPEFMADDSLVVLCLNSPDLDDAFLRDTVAEHCPSCTFEHSIHAPEVFKEAHQGKGLKVHVYRYIAS